MVTIKYYVHGQTDDNATKKSTGWKNSPINDKGIDQAAELAKKIKDLNFDVIISSDLSRAYTSAKIAFAFSDAKIIKDKRMREGNYGDYNGQDEKLVDYSKYIDKNFPNGECLKDVEKRVREFCKRLKEKYDGKTVAIMAHRAPQLSLEIICNKKTWEQALKDDWRNTGAWQPGWTYILR